MTNNNNNNSQSKNKPLPKWKLIIKTLIGLSIFFLTLSIIVSTTISFILGLFIFLSYWFIHRILYKKAKTLYIEERKEKKDELGESLFFLNEFLKQDNTKNQDFNKEKEKIKNKIDFIKQDNKLNNYTSFQFIIFNNNQPKIDYEIDKNYLTLKYKQFSTTQELKNIYIESSEIIGFNRIGHYKEKPIYEYIFILGQIFNFESITIYNNNLNSNNDKNYVHINHLLYKEADPEVFLKTLLKK